MSLRLGPRDQLCTVFEQVDAVHVRRRCRAEETTPLARRRAWWKTKPNVCIIRL